PHRARPPIRHNTLPRPRPLPASSLPRGHRPRDKRRRPTNRRPHRAAQPSRDRHRRARRAVAPRRARRLLPHRHRRRQPPRRPHPAPPRPNPLARRPDRYRGPACRSRRSTRSCRPRTGPNPPRQGRFRLPQAVPRINGTMVRLLVTRPEPDASETAARLRALDIEAVVEPLLVAQTLTTTLPPRDGFAALAITSAN